MTQTEMTARDLTSWVGRTAVDSDGDKIGTIFDVYLDDDSGQPEWLAVNTGMFGNKVSFVPLAGASPHADGVMVGYDKATVEAAPNADADGALSPEEERALYQHYGYDDDVIIAEPAARPIPAPDRAVRSDVADDAMTRSEEELDVTKSRRQSGTARLHKWIETEDVQITVPVRREKARLVTESITDANRGAAMQGAAITEAEHEIVLSEEVIDIDKHVVAKERVRLETETETVDVAVEETVRKERLQFDGDVERATQATKPT